MRASGDASSAISRPRQSSSVNVPLGDFCSSLGMGKHQANAIATAGTTRIETTKTLRPETLGSARDLACWRWRPRHRELLKMCISVAISGTRGVFRRGRRNVHARARALPRINRRRRRIHLRATGRRNGCRTWARLAWLASGRCPQPSRGPGWSTCLSRDRRCQNKEELRDLAVRSTTSLTNDPADRTGAADRIFRRSRDSDSPLRRLRATRPRPRQNSEASAYSGGT